MSTSEASELARVKADLAADRGIYFPPGATVTSHLITQLLKLLPKTIDGNPIVRDANFRGVTFSEDGIFSNCLFRGPADFAQSVFEARASFKAATFESTCNFSGASFTALADFAGATFYQTATLPGIHFASDVSFDQASWHAAVTFDQSIFAAACDFTIRGISGEASLNQCVWAAAKQLGPIRATGTLSLFATSFAKRIDLIAEADLVDLAFSNFDSGGHLQLAARQVSIPSATFGSATSLSGIISTIPNYITNRQRAGLPRLTAKLSSVDRADVSNLSLDHIDLSEALLAGAVGLDKIRIHSSVSFGVAPRWRAHRKIIADEALFRSARRPEGPWTWQPESGLSPERTASDIAAAYRSIRKGLEDERNEPSASDFYYGEMEMRRIGTMGAQMSRFDHFVLSAYWLVAGYATRALRSFGLLLVAMIVSAWAMSGWGFDPTPTPSLQIEQITPAGAVEYRPGQPASTTFADGLRFSIEASTSLLRTPTPVSLTTAGRSIEILLRVIGPVLLAFTILSLRSRIKR